MNSIHRTTVALSGAAVAAGLLVGCGGGEESPDNPTTSGVVTSDASTPSATTSATTSAPAPAETTAPAGDGSQAPTTAQTPGPSQTVSGGNSATPPPVPETPSPPTGDNLPGEDAGPQGQPGEPGRN